MPTPTVINRYQYPQSISRNVWDQNYQYENWKTPPVFSGDGTIAGLNAATNNNILRTPNLTLEFNPIGTQVAPTLAPKIAEVSEGVSSLDLAMTQTASLGVELCPGITKENPLAFKMGSSAAIFVRAKLKIATVAGAATCAVGFRVCAAYQQAFLSYSDVVALNAAAGTINVSTVQTSGAPITTNTTQTWANAATHEFMVLIDSTGVVSYQIDKATPTVVPTLPYQFTAAMYVVPFLMIKQAAAVSLSGTVNLLEWECGFQS